MVSVGVAETATRAALVATPVDKLLTQGACRQVGQGAPHGRHCWAMAGCDALTREADADATGWVVVLRVQKAVRKAAVDV